MDSLDQLLAKKLRFSAATNHDSRLVARGDFMKTTKQLAACDRIRYPDDVKVKAKLKSPKALHEMPTSGSLCQDNKTIGVAATDESGQTATDEIKVTLFRNKRWID